MDWKSELVHYVEAPEADWPAVQRSQATKLRRALEQRARIEKQSIRTIVDRSLELAHKRAAKPPKTLFLINCGSSGSHWLQGMLAAVPGIRDCGEVYVRTDLPDVARKWPNQSRWAFLDALHQVHVKGRKEPAIDDVLMNSAHGWVPFGLMPSDKVSMLLIRDPLDIVISRTFRKLGFRSHVAPDSSDSDYLERNILIVEKFFRSAQQKASDCVVRYEDIRHDPVPVLARMTSLLLDIPPDVHLLSSIATRHSAEVQASTSRRLSNLYQGPEITVPDHMHEFARCKLEGIRQAFGYRS